MGYAFINFKDVDACKRSEQMLVVSSRVCLLGFSSGHYFSQSSNDADNVCDVQRARHVCGDPACLVFVVLLWHVKETILADAVSGEFFSGTDVSAAPAFQPSLMLDR